MVVRTCEEDLAMDFLNVMSGISNVVGVPCTLILAWLIFEVRNMKKRIEELEKARETDRKEQDFKLSEIYSKLNTLVSDVSYIRGRMERDEK